MAILTEFEPVIGLEVHAELQTRSKMFCSCPVVDTATAAPNSATCEICTGMPGTLPVINVRAIEYALRAALALNCRIAETSLFARKNYFYPDLPKGYKISQYERPLARDGWLEFETPQGIRRVSIRRVHLEEDTGKLFHRQGASLVDFNRCGVPLLEVVTEPELHSLDDVKGYAIGLRSLLRYLDITTGDMEKGAIRFEANVSVRPAGATFLGTRTEIKNLNSFRAMLRALDFEIERHSRLLAQGGQVRQETLRWNEVRGETYPERGKEEADDYRYFPEPDLPPLAIDAAWLEQIASTLSELPSAKRDRFIQQYGLGPYMAGVLTAERAVADYFEAATRAAGGLPAEKIAHWVTGELFSLLNQAGLEIQQSRVSPQALAELVVLIERNQINQTAGKALLAGIFQNGGSPAEIVRQRGLSQLTDPATIDRLVNQVLQENPEQLALYLQGKAPVAQWFFGQVMRAAQGRADPQLVRRSLEAALQARQTNMRFGPG
jgi:aspartyl-tRNA(Asn)/glutamyl-tRNA(Gln) amidotransferase subunit B